MNVNFVMNDGCIFFDVQVINEKYVFNVFSAPRLRKCVPTNNVLST